MIHLNTPLKSLALGIALLGTTGLTMLQPVHAESPAGAPVKAERVKHHRGGGCGVMKQLGLSEDQKQKLKAQHQTFRQENATLISDMKSKFQQLRQLPKTPENQAQRDQLRAELRKDREAMHAKHLTIMQQVLTAEQLQRYKTLKQECKAKRPHKFQDKNG